MTVGPIRFVRDTVADVRLVARGWRWGVGRQALVPRSAEPFVPAHSTRVFPTRWARTPPINALREILLGVGMHWLLRSQVSVRVQGLDILARTTGPVIFVANHSSHVDTPMILTTLPPAWRRKTAMAAAADYFFDTWWRAAGSAILFNTFPIERRGGGMSNTPGHLIADGWNMVWFPEGTRTSDGWTAPFKLGASFVALGAQVPVIPIAIQGGFNAMPRGQGWPSPGRPRVTIRYGEPIMATEGEGPRDFGRRIEQGVAALLDEESTDWYDARRRSTTGQTPAAAGPPVGRWRRVWEASQPPTVAAQRRIWR